MQRIDSLSSPLPWDTNDFASGLQTWMKSSLDLATQKLKSWMDVPYPHPRRAQQWSSADMAPAVAELAITLLVCRERHEVSVVVLWIQNSGYECVCIQVLADEYPNPQLAEVLFADFCRVLLLHSAVPPPFCAYLHSSPLPLFSPRPLLQGSLLSQL